MDNLDFAWFKTAYYKPAGYLSYFDFDGDGDIDNLDFAYFKLRYYK